MKRATPRKCVHCSIVLSVGGALLVLLVTLLTPVNPVADGKPLSEWLRVYGPNSRVGLDSAERRRADDAFRSLGPKAIPFLVHELRADDSRAKIWCQMVLQRARLATGPYFSAADRNVAASRAFLVLGSTASNAVPDLIAIRETAPSIHSQIASLYALAWIGPSARAATPVLLRDAASSHPRVRAAAAFALGEIRPEPSLAVPLLTDALNSSNEWVQACAARALGNFGASASSAIPTLSEVANRVLTINCDRNAEARAEALNAIQKLQSAEHEATDLLSAFTIP